MSRVWHKVESYVRLFNKYQNHRINAEHAIRAAMYPDDRVAHTKRLTLDCGHFNYRKGHVPVPKRARCRECENHAPKKPPISVAFEEWSVTGDGLRATNGMASGTYLYNRLRAAFEAGWHAAQGRREIS